MLLCQAIGKGQSNDPLRAPSLSSTLPLRLTIPTDRTRRHCWTVLQHAAFPSLTDLTCHCEEPGPCPSSCRQCAHKASNKGGGTGMDDNHSFGDRDILFDVSIILLCGRKVSGEFGVCSTRRVQIRRVLSSGGFVQWLLGNSLC
jgi:hypothetical protein